MCRDRRRTASIRCAVRCGLRVRLAARIRTRWYRLTVVDRPSLEQIARYRAMTPQERKDFGEKIRAAYKLGIIQ